MHFPRNAAFSPRSYVVRIEAYGSAGTHPVARTVHVLVRAMPEPGLAKVTQVVPDDEGYCARFTSGGVDC